MKCLPITGLAFAFLLSACANLPLTTSFDTTATALNGHYVLIQSDLTALRSAANDSGNIVLLFDIDVPVGMQFFDGDGLALKSVREKNAVSISGLHSGVLVKLGDAMSFVAVREGQSLSNGPQVTPTPLILSLRRKALESGPAKDAMQRAMAAVQGKDATAAARLASRARSAVAKPTTSKTTDLVSRAPGKSSTPPTEPAIDWRASSPPGLPSSRLSENGQSGYITFIGNGLQPVQAVPVIEALTARASKSNGVVLISGIAPTRANPTTVNLARERAAFIEQVFHHQGVDARKTWITAVFRTDAHVRKDQSRPGNTVNLTWLPSETK